MKILFIFLILFINSLLYSQDTHNINYFNQLKSIVAKDTNVIKIKYFQQKYFNGKIKSQTLFVKLKNDPKKKYWKVGKDFYYFKNGQLASVEYTNEKTTILSDTAYFYNKDGIFFGLVSYNEEGNKAIPVKLLDSFEYIFHKFWTNYPSKYKNIYYNNGKKTSECPVEYFETTGSVKHGNVIFYKEDGSIDKILIYEKGVLKK